MAVAHRPIPAALEKETATKVMTHHALEILYVELITVLRILGLELVM